MLRAGRVRLIISPLYLPISRLYLRAGRARLKADFDARAPPPAGAGGAGAGGAGLAGEGADFCAFAAEHANPQTKYLLSGSAAIWPAEMRRLDPAADALLLPRARKVTLTRTLTLTLTLALALPLPLTPTPNPSPNSTQVLKEMALVGQAEQMDWYLQLLRATLGLPRHKLSAPSAGWAAAHGGGASTD